MNKRWIIKNNKIQFDQHFIFTTKNFKNITDSFKYTYNLSQEEIDKILQEIKNDEQQLQFTYQPQYVTFDPKENIKTEPNGNKCTHQFVEYVGLFEKFHHCKLCGQKQ